MKQRMCSRVKLIKRPDLKQRKQDLLVASEQELAYLKQERLALEEQGRGFRGQVFDREARVRRIDGLVAAAQAAVKDGYLRGIRDNEAALLLGKKPISKDKGGDDNE